MTQPMTQFEREIREQPEVLTRILGDAKVIAAAEVLRAQDRGLIMSLARGSSDNAVTFFGYLAGRFLGLPLASLPPSLVTVYAAKMKAAGALAVGVSQSGESSDVLEGLRALKAAGALTVAISNDPESSLSRLADLSLEQRAGEEQAVAASKTFSSQMMLLALLVAHWSEDAGLLTALQAVPERMRALLGDQSAVERAATRLTHAEHAYVLGRGLSYGPALELALKLKETSYLHAEAFSSAEFQHGPIAAVDPRYPVILLATQDGSLESNLAVAERLCELEADLTVVSGAQALEAYAGALVALPEGLHPATEAFLQVLAGQLLALHLAQSKRLDPDKPRHLSKITKTM
ncbi:MAG: SIS domain-containing protein [Deinococcota bacterium]|jgi:glucosamine--fructose-6-phosphate aminotransferase (isomerizing)|nr:SIS domain-containing protein [Deinococcota bacterium]